MLHLRRLLHVLHAIIVKNHDGAMCISRWYVKNKEFYYIATLGDVEEKEANTTIACFRGYAECVDGANEKGILIASNVYEAGTVASTFKMEEAYVMGKNV